MMLKYITKPTRKGVADALLILALIGSVISVILVFIVFIAGTTIIRGDPDHLLWRPLALVSVCFTKPHFYLIYLIDQFFELHRLLSGSSK